MSWPFAVMRYPLYVYKRSRYAVPVGCWKSLKRGDYPNYVVKDPERSVLFEVKAAELVSSTTFATKFTLRFPRVVRIRYDKPVSECLTDVELEELANHAGGRLARTSSDGVYAKKRPRVAPRAGGAFSVAGGFKTTFRTETPGTVAGPLHGKHILVDPALHDRDTIVSCALSLGASSVCGTLPAGGDGVSMAIASRAPSGALNALTTSFIAQTCGLVDVVSPDWLVDCMKEECLLPLEPRYVLHACDATRLAFSRWVDTWGGSHVRPESPAAFAEYWHRIPEDIRVMEIRQAAPLLEVTPTLARTTGSLLDGAYDVVYHAAQLCASVAKEIRDDAAVAAIRSGAFRGPVAYDDLALMSDGHQSPSESSAGQVVFFWSPGNDSATTCQGFSWSRIQAAQVLSGGGNVATTLHSHVTVVIVQRGEVSCADVLRLRRELRALSRENVPIVWGDWVGESLAANAMLPLRKFLCSL